MADEQQIETELRQRGALPAAALRKALQISQPTLSRLIVRAGQDVIHLGRGRASHYAMVRATSHGAGSSWPLYAIDPQGKPHRVGLLHALQNRQWALVQDEPWDALRGAEFPIGLYPDFPWFLADLRPQGFLGRAFARTHAGNLGLPPNPVSWTADDVVTALLRFGYDLPGSFVIGEQMLMAAQDRVLNPPAAVPVTDRADAYHRLAEETLKGEWPGSSAAGEQPKFITRIRCEDGAIRHVIVKFSGSGDRPEDHRWRDLLIAEHIAAALLSENGIPAAETSLVESGGRAFLESTRFDRIGANGRRGVVSFMAVDAAFFGEIYTSWVAASQRLLSARWLEAGDAERLAELWWFGLLIANTDMHYGNASLFLDSSRPLSLTPAYDMLPMFYRPNVEGRLPEHPYNPPPPVPESMGAWLVAVELAGYYWERIAAEPRISDQFRTIGRQNVEIIAKYQRSFS